METRLTILKDSKMISEAVSEQILAVYTTLLPAYRLGDETSHTFLTHLAMAMMRLETGEAIQPLDNQIKAELECNAYFDESQVLVGKIMDTLATHLPLNELDYLYVHLCAMLERVSQEVLLDGYTLMHEHMTIDLSGVKQDADCHIDCMKETLNELESLYAYGVRNIVDVTLPGMGRDMVYFDKLQQQTPIRLLPATGFYKEPFLPTLVATKSVDELATMMMMEIEQGIEGSGYKAVIIGEIGTSKDVMLPLEQKVFDAAIQASLKTDTPITTHTTLGTYAYEQAKYLLERGVAPHNIIIGHQDLSNNIEQIKQLLALGVYVGFDTVGKINYVEDVDRAKMLYELQQASLLNQVILSLDITRKSHLKQFGGSGYAYLFETFLPLLKTIGVHQQSIEMLLKENPKRIFRKELQ